LTVWKETSLTADDRKILDLKYGGKQFGQMTPPERLLNAKALLLKIHIITGWSIPENKLMDILVDQFTKSLEEKFENLNSSEIEYAFRSAGTTIEDWGKSMNLNLLDKVLLPYLNDRYKISEVERQIAYKKNLVNLEPGENDYRRMIEEDYQSFLAGMVYQTFPVPYYPQLVKDGFIIEAPYYLMPDEEKDRCVLKVFEQAKEAGIENLYRRS